MGDGVFCIPELCCISLQCVCCSQEMADNVKPTMQSILARLEGLCRGVTEYAPVCSATTAQMWDLPPVHKVMLAHYGDIAPPMVETGHRELVFGLADALAQLDISKKELDAEVSQKKER